MMRFLLVFTLLCSTVFMAFTPPPAEIGMATVYDDGFHGRKTACSGEKYDKALLTAAHKTLPCGTIVKVTHLGNKKSVTVKINDRGPYIKGKIISLSRAAAQKIDLLKDQGETKVKIEVVSAPQKQDNTVTARGGTNTNTTKKDVKKVAPKPQKKAEPKLNIVKEAAAIETGGLYKMQVLKLEPKGFGVQVAGYSDYESVIQQVATLQKNWFKGALVFADELNGKPFYKIIMGPFFTKEEANSYCENLKKKYNVKGAFVVDLAKMKASN
jgi:rare lipoprotein A